MIQLIKVCSLKVDGEKNGCLHPDICGLFKMSLKSPVLVFGVFSESTRGDIACFCHNIIVVLNVLKPVEDRFSFAFSPSLSSIRGGAVRVFKAVKTLIVWGFGQVFSSAFSEVVGRRIFEYRCTQYMA